MQLLPGRGCICRGKNWYLQNPNFPFLFFRLTVAVVLKLPEDNSLLEANFISLLSTSVQVVENDEGVVTLILSGTKQALTKALTLIRKKRESIIAEITGVPYEDSIYIKARQMHFKRRMPEGAIKKAIAINGGNKDLYPLCITPDPKDLESIASFTAPTGQNKSSNKTNLSGPPPPPPSPASFSTKPAAVPRGPPRGPPRPPGGPPLPPRGPPLPPSRDSTVPLPPMRMPPFLKNYEVMFRLGCTPGQVKHKMKRDGVDLSNYDTYLAHFGQKFENPPKKKKSRMVTSMNYAEEISPGLKKGFERMKNAGVPNEKIKECMEQAGVNPDLFEVFWPNAVCNTTSGPAPPPLRIAPPPAAAPRPVPRVVPPHLQRYVRMQGMGIPRDAIKNVMTRRGDDPNQWDIYFPPEPQVLQNSTVCDDEKEEIVTHGKKKRGLPKRKRQKPTKAIRPVFIDKLAARRVKKAEFWMDIINRDLDDVLEIDGDEVEYSMATKKDRLNMDGFWYMGHISQPTVLEVQKGVVLYHNAGRKVGTLKIEQILWDRNWGDYRIDFGKSKGNFEINDFMTWKHLHSGEICVWQRYTNTMALRTILWDTDLEFPMLIVSCLQSFLGDKTYVKQKEKKEKKKKDKIGIVNYKTVQDASFALQLYKLSSEERMLDFRDCLLAMDEKRLFDEFHVQQIPQLANFFPTTEELRAVAGLAYESIAKNPVYLWFYTLSTIPNLRQRMENWKFKIEFLENLTHVYNNLSSFEDGARFWSESESLKLMFGLILKLSNFINHNVASRKNAYGFELSSLPRLSRSFLNYLILLCDDKYPKALEFVKEYQDILDARIQHLEFQDVRNDLNEIKNGFRNILRIGAHDRSAFAQDKYVDVMGKFQSYANHRITECDNCLNDVISRYQVLNMAFACSNQEFDILSGPMSAFTYMTEFHQEVKKIVADIQKQKERMASNIRNIEFREQRKLELAERRKKLKEEKEKEKSEELKDKEVDFLTEWRAKSKKKRKINYIEIDEDSDPFNELSELKARLDRSRAQKQV